MKISKWTKEQIAEFRQWHEHTINSFYAHDLDLQMELRMDREQWLMGVSP